MSEDAATSSDAAGTGSPTVFVAPPPQPGATPVSPPTPLDEADKGDVYTVFLDAQGVVTSHAHSNLPQLGGIAVSKEVYDAVKLRVTGACRLIDGQVQDYTPPPAPPSVPATVTNYQARAVLVERGLFDKVDTALRSADMTVTANRIALQAWDYANGFSRNSAIVTAMAGVLGLSSDDVDGLFIAAAAVQ